MKKLNKNQNAVIWTSHFYNTIKSKDWNHAIMASSLLIRHILENKYNIKP
jgi:hypothetical protein